MGERTITQLLTRLSQLYEDELYDESADEQLNLQIDQVYDGPMRRLCVGPDNQHWKSDLGEAVQDESHMKAFLRGMEAATYIDTEAQVPYQIKQQRGEENEA